jgi:hypothetical protein
MTRFNRKQPVRQATPIVSASAPGTYTYNQAAGFVRDPKSELFLLAVTNMVGNDTFYEKTVLRDQRFKNLVHEVAVSDPLWMARFLPWLRDEANMRTASLVAAVEFAKARLDAGAPSVPGVDSDRGVTRLTVDRVIRRADELGEVLGYWKATYPGKQLPKPIKRGVADAVGRLYNERNTLKYDTASHAFRFGDVLELVHAKPNKPYQSVLFKHLIDRRHGRDGIPSSLTLLSGNQDLRAQLAQGPVTLSSELLSNTGMTWEDTLSLAGSKVSKKELWEAQIPSMGYMALLRNLRNFDEAGVSDAAAAQVMAKLTNPVEVSRSRQLPMRFLSAYRAAPSLRWAYPLEQALNLSLQNVPLFPGKTLVLIDTSGSMDNRFSADGTLRRWDAAALFGLAVAHRCEKATVVSFGGRTKEFPLERGESVLRSLERFKGGYFFGGGTPTKQTVDAFYSGHDRVLVLTDEQADRHGGLGVFDRVPLNKVAITFNLAGYRVGHAASGSDTRITIGGLSDAAFTLLPMLEKRASGEWPF